MQNISFGWRQASRNWFLARRTQLVQISCMNVVMRSSVLLHFRISVALETHCKREDVFRRVRGALLAADANNDMKAAAN